DVRVVDMQSGTNQVLSTSPEAAFFASWAPDSSAVAMLDPYAGTVSIAGADGTVRFSKSVEGAGHGSWNDDSSAYFIPVGGTFCYPQDSSPCAATVDPVLWRLDATDGTLTEVLRGSAANYSNIHANVAITLEVARNVGQGQLLVRESSSYGDGGSAPG